MNDVLGLAIEAVNRAKVAYCKTITANDAGKTKSHQSGFHLHKESWSLYFDRAGEKGEMLEKFAEIKWQGDFTTSSRFIYYGKKSRDEYRLTRFGKGFPFLQDESIGDLLIVCKIDEAFYEAFVLSTDDAIETFLASVNIDVSGINKIIPKTKKVTGSLASFYIEFIDTLKRDFPSAKEISTEARRILAEHFGYSISDLRKQPDRTLLEWIDIEYQLFRTIEINRYSGTLKKGFKNVDALVKFSNSILNRRKSRAGKSLENHLEEIFTMHALRFEAQVRTEGRKKPDFIFPGAQEYRNINFDFENLVFLGAKTTCKDRWRQVLNEASRIPAKHLFTLQQGISANQLAEMKDENLTLVVPQKHIKLYPKEWRKELMSLGAFINFVRGKQ